MIDNRIVSSVMVIKMGCQRETGSPVRVYAELELNQIVKSSRIIPDEGDSHLVLWQHRPGQLTGESRRCLHLFQQETRVDVGNGVVGGMHVWILITMIILDLHRSYNSLRTEGTLIPSVTTRYDLGDQIQLICLDDAIQLLNEIYRLFTVP